MAAQNARVMPMYIFSNYMRGLIILVSICTPPIYFARFAPPGPDSQILVGGGFLLKA